MGHCRVAILYPELSSSRLFSCAIELVWSWYDLKPDPNKRSSLEEMLDCHPKSSAGRQMAKRTENGFQGREDKLNVISRSKQKTW